MIEHQFVSNEQGAQTFNVLTTMGYRSRARARRRRITTCALWVAVLSTAASSSSSIPLVVEGYTLGSPTALIARGWKNTRQRQRQRDADDLQLFQFSYRRRRLMFSSSQEREQNVSTIEPLPPRRSIQSTQHDNRHSFDHDDDEDQATPLESSSFEEHQIIYEWDTSLTSFNMDLHNLAMEDPAKAHDAVEVMRELYAKHPDSSATVLPDATCYTTVMDGYIHAGKLEQAQAVMDRMEELASADELERRKGDANVASDSMAVVVSPFAPTDFTYILMAQAWANDHREDFTGTSAENAVAILRRMQVASTQRIRQSRPGPVDPDSMTSSIVKVWTIVVEGWCKRSGITRQAMQRAEELLLEMEDETQTLVRPNVLTYTSFIGGLSRCKENDMARKAEAVLERMERHDVQPDMVAYTSVINCWAKAVSRRERGMAATRALSILGDMERMYISKKMYNVKPSMITYATTIAAIGNSLDPEAPQLAEGVLQRMQKLQTSGAIANLKPGTATYNAVIYALSRAPVSNRLRYAQRAEQLLDEMWQRAQQGEKDVQPDVRTWAAVLRAWTRSKQPDAAENAQRVLGKMEYRYKKGMSSVRPNFVCFTTVMGAWGYSKSDDALDKMERILVRMEEGYEETLEPDIRPNTVSYVTVSLLSGAGLVVGLSDSLTYTKLTRS